jgi:hypothetical protein
MSSEMSQLPSLSSVGGPLAAEPSGRAAAVTALTGFQIRWSQVLFSRPRGSPGGADVRWTSHFAGSPRGAAVNATAARIVVYEVTKAALSRCLF